MNRIRRILLGTILLTALLASLPAIARPYPYQGEAPQRPPNMEQPQNQMMDLNSAVAQVRAQTGGRVLAASTKYVDGRPVHVVRVLTRDGRVRTFRIDAQSGSWLR